MDLQQLRCFREMAITKNYKQATKDLALSRSGISVNIRDLENELAVSLFSAGNKKIELTRYGEALLPKAEQILDVLDDSVERIQKMREKEKRHEQVTVMHSNILSYTVLPVIFKELYKRDLLDERHVNMIINSSIEDVNHMLLCGKADVAFFVAQPTKDLNYLRIAKDQLYVMLPRKHPLAERKKVRLSELKDEKFIYPSLNNCNHVSYMDESISMMFKSENIKPETMNFTGLLKRRLMYVSMGYGYTISPKFPIDEKYIAAVEIDNPYSTREVYLIWPQNRKVSGGAKVIIDFCVDYFKDKNDMVFA